MHRVFFGQLPKDRAMEVLDWLLHLMSPSVLIFHIEAHTAKGGRGKGCAWVYVRTVACSPSHTGICILLTEDDGKDVVKCCEFSFRSRSWLGAWPTGTCLFEIFYPAHHVKVFARWAPTPLSWLTQPPGV